MHEKMRRVMGCEGLVRVTDDPKESPWWDLPESLAPGAPPPKAPDGVSDLVIPDWTASVVAPANARVVDTTVSLVMQSGHKSERNLRYNHEYDILTGR